MIGVIAALVVLTFALIWLIYDHRKMKATIDDLNKPSMVKDSMIDYISVGDSHIYLLRGTDLTLINREHSFGALLMEKAARGEVDPNEPYDVNPKRNALTAYIGIGNFNTVDRNVQPILLKDGDKILLCSDGVYNVLGDDALIDALKGDPIDLDNLRSNVNHVSRSQSVQRRSFGALGVSIRHSSCVKRNYQRLWQRNFSRRQEHHALRGFCNDC